MRKAIYAGSFDPVTKGHLDIIERASLLVDELVVTIMANDSKSCTFSEAERKEMLEESVKHLSNVKVAIGTGLTVNYAKSIGASIMVRGIRAVSDYEYEMQLATSNQMLDGSIETVFLISKPEYSFMSSSGTKTIAKYHGSFESFVPEAVIEPMKEKFR